MSSTEIVYVRYSVMILTKIVFFLLISTEKMGSAAADDAIIVPTFRHFSSDLS